MTSEVFIVGAVRTPIGVSSPKSIRELGASSAHASVICRPGSVASDFVREDRAACKRIQ
jgi:hypothetical protein